MRQITRVLARADGPLTAATIATGVMAERGEHDSDVPRNITQSTHRALRALVDRGEVVRLHAADGLSEYVFELATSDDLVARLTPAVESSARRLTQRDYVAVCAALIDALPVEEARGLVDMLNDRLARRLADATRRA